MAKKKVEEPKKKNNAFIYLPAIIALTAALVVSIVMLINRFSTLRSLLTIFGFLVGFYILGTILMTVLNAVASKEPEPEEEETELEDIQTSDEENMIRS